ncbi:heavy metal transporter [Streptomyces sp. NPDC088354]|uniref:heavy metal transporter n=1 Tax=Streptomyces sp. NPDC088354 TaxID=3365856 RepID=UPI0038202D44
MPKPTSTSSPAARAPKKRGRAVRVVTAALVLLGVAGYAAHHFGVIGGPGPVECTVTAEGGTLRLEPQQAANASTIAAVASSRGLPERAVAIALATSMQESALRNIDHGDRDSMGLFQQRPSQGWGTAAQIMDPVYASNEFFDGLVKIQGYSRLPLTVAAQRVQKSGYPQAYAKHETDAALLAAALTGRHGAALTCTTADGERTVTGGDPAKVRARLVREFGPDVAPRTTAAADRDPGAGAEGDAKNGGTADRAGAGGRQAAGPRTVAVPSAPADGRGRGGDARRGWELAQWAVAHAHELKVEKVAFADREWSAAASGKGWTKSNGADSGAAADDVRITVAQ